MRRSLPSGRPVWRSVTGSRRLTPEDEKVLRLVGEHLGSLASRDLKARCPDAGDHSTDTWAARKQDLTADSSSRWAGAITKATHDQWALARRCQLAHIQGLEAGVRDADAPPVPADRGEGHQACCGRLPLEGRVVPQIPPPGDPGTPARRGPRGPRGRCRARRARWPNVCSTPGTTSKPRSSPRPSGGSVGRPHAGSSPPTASPASDTGTRRSASPRTARCRIKLPAPLADWANAKHGRYVLARKVAFPHRGQEWADRIDNNRAVAYRIHYDVERGRWYLTASWQRPRRPDDPAGDRPRSGHDRRGHERRPLRRLPARPARQPGRRPTPLLLRPVRHR